MVLPTSFVPKEKWEKEEEKRRFAEQKKEEQKRKFAAEKAKQIAKKALEEKAKREQISPHDVQAAREHAQRKANEIYSKMKEAERAKEAAQSLRPESKRSLGKPSIPNPFEGVAEAIGNKLKRREKSGTHESKKDSASKSSPKETFKDTKRKTEKPQQYEVKKKRPSDIRSGKREQRSAETKKKAFLSNDDKKELASKKKRREIERFASKPDKGHPELPNPLSNDAPKPKEHTKRSELERKFEGSNLHEVKLRPVEIRGVQFDDATKLTNFINEELSGMKHLPNFNRMMDDALAHIELRKLIGDRTHLTFSEIRELSQQIERPLRTTRKWVTESGNTKLCRFAETAITRSEAKVILDRLRLSRNEINGVSDVDKRLSTLFTGDHVRRLKSFDRDLDMSRKYFTFLELLSEGGIVTDIARRAGVSPLAGRNYTEGIFPYLVKRVVEVPSTLPRDGWKWLPMDINGISQNIEVPLKPKVWSEVQEVLNQVGFDRHKMSQLSSKFGIQEIESAFMYALGAIIADGNLSKEKLSSRMTLPLSKKYDWSTRFGEAVCLCLESLGINTEKRKDWAAPNNIITDRGKSRRISGPGFHVWESAHHPLLRWVRESCFGLKMNQTKIENPINADWVLNAPRKYRISLLQGIADGDGFVCVNSQYAGLSTRVNQRLFGQLLGSLDIESHETKKDVLILKTESIQKLAKIGLFNYAESRKKELEEVNELVISRKAKPVGSHLSKAEIDHAVLLRGEGKSYGEITKLVYKKFGNSWNISTIEHAIKKQFRSSNK